MSYPFQNSSYNHQRPYGGQGQPPPPYGSANPYYVPYQPPQPQPQYGPSPPPSAHSPHQHAFPSQPTHANHTQTPQPCYNCGATTHWAQYCPEPRRAVPAGSLSQGHDNRPYKRQKTNRPVITRYGALVHPEYPPPPPQQQQQQHHHPGQHGFPPPQQPQAYWPQGGYPSAPQPYTYGGPYGSQGPHTPVSPYGPNFSPPGPPPQVHPSPANYHPPQMHHQYPVGPPRGGYPDPTRRRSFRQEQPHGWSQQTTFQPANQHRAQPSRWASFSHDRALKEATPVAASVSPGIKNDPHEPYDDDPDDLQTLDFVTEQLPKDLPVRVGRPLLANPTAPNAFGPLLAVVSQGKYSVSEYFTSENLAEMEKSIKDAPYWPEFSEDPAFLEISNGGNVIPSPGLQDGHLQTDHSDKDSGPEHETQDTSLLPKEHQEPDVNGPLDSADKGHISRGSTSPSLDMQPTPAGDGAEEMLARLGVTGAPKPVVKTALVSRPDRVVRHHSDSSVNSHPVQHYESSNSGWKKEPADATQFSSRSTWPERENNANSDDFTSQNSPEGNHHASSDVASNTNGRYDRSYHRRSASPHDEREEQGTERKKDYRQRREAEVRKGEPRRQVDDVTPRFRSRQPKVAEAYSRRW